MRSSRAFRAGSLSPVSHWNGNEMELRTSSAICMNGSGREQDVGHDLRANLGVRVKICWKILNEHHQVCEGMCVQIVHRPKTIRSRRFSILKSVSPSSRRKSGELT